MKVRRFFALTIFAAALAAISASAALGQSGDGNLANVIGGGSSVKFDVVAQNAGVSLTVIAPDGRSFTKEYRGGASPVFDLSDKGLPDGTYSYELRLRPALSGAQRDAMKSARGKDDDPESDRAARKPSSIPALIQSGAFTLLNGQVIVGGLSEGRATAKAASAPAETKTAAPFKTTTTVSSPVTSGNTASRLRNHRVSLLANYLFDFVIADDLIVQGSACVGLDCVDGESFGFDTIRVKENNTRIQFDDTSTSAGFPSNNWQIRANSSASGGGNFLAFVDQGTTGNSETGTIVIEVDAGAPANSLRVSSGGNIGIGTATPVLYVHVNTTDTPAMRFEQNNSGGFTAQTWDVAGNEANFFVRDVTGGSRLPFRIRPGAPTSSVDISASGNVGILTASPNTALEVNGVIRQGVTHGISIGSDAGRNRIVGFGSAPEFQFINSSNALGNIGARAASIGLNFGSVAAPTNGAIIEGNVGIATNAPTANLSVNGTANKPGGGSWDVFSDERLKNIKGSYRSGLSAVMQLNPIRYEYLKNNALGLKSDGEHIGFGAQELQKVLPEAVTRNSEGYLMVNNDPIIWTMLNAIKEQQKEIEQLKSQIRKMQTHRRRR